VKNKNKIFVTTIFVDDASDRFDFLILIEAENNMLQPLGSIFF